MKINFFKKRNSFKKENFALNPGSYWNMMVLSSFIAIILLVLFGYSLFRQTNQEPVLLSKYTSGETPLVDKNYITKVLDYFSQREDKSNKIVNSKAPVVDPTL